MKVNHKKILRAALLFLVAAIAIQVKAQVTPEDPTSLVQEFTANIDKLGDADLQVTQKMTATQWEYFKNSPIYNDPAMAKRDMERNMATYVIEDFKRDMDDINRTVKLSLKVKSYAQYKGDGHWLVKIESKNPQVTKLTDNAYMITGNAVAGNSLIQQIFKIYFPSSASKVTQTTDEFGKAIFTYDEGKGIGSYAKWNNILGILLIAAAIYLIIKQLPAQNLKTARA